LASRPLGKSGSHQNSLLLVKEPTTYYNIIFQGIAVTFEEFYLGRRTIVVSRNYRKPEFVVDNVFIGAMDMKPVFKVPRRTRFSSSDSSDDGDCFEPVCPIGWLPVPFSRVGYNINFYGSMVFIIGEIANFSQVN